MNNKRELFYQQKMKVNTNQTPLVSIIVAVYNDPPEYIKQSLDSLDNQTYPNIEIIVLDDSSMNESKDAIDNYAHNNKFQIIRKNKRMGFVCALNTGLELARGYYIARMDSDDICAYDRIEKQVDYLEKNKGISIVGGQIDIIDEKGIVISHRKYPLAGMGLYVFSLFRDPLAHPTVMMRRTLVDEGFRYDETMKKAEDIDLWLRMMNRGCRIANHPDTLLKYRIEDGFNKKRTGEQQEYVYKARMRNLSIRRPMFSFFSMICTTLYRHAPYRLMASIYNKENGKG